MKPELIVALDVSNRVAMERALQRLPNEISWFKVGLEAFCSEGPSILAPLQTRAKNIFLDLKLHDIPRTVEKAVRAISRHNVHLLTLHASGGRAMVRAAAEAAAETPGLRLLAVTVLTSLDQCDLGDLGVQRPPRDQAVALAEMACESGAHGIVCSLHEAAAIRKALGPNALIVTPGIRLPGDAVGDQKRVGTPRAAMLAGASHLVVGRPILDAADPAEAYRLMLHDMD